MTNVIDFLFIRFNEIYTEWKKEPNQEAEFVRDQSENRKILNEIVDAVVILKTSKERL